MVSRRCIDSLFTAQKAEMRALIEESTRPAPIERRLSKWERLKQEAGRVTIVTVMAGLVVAVLWLIKKAKNQR